MDTRQKQLAAWCSLVLSFCRLHKQSSMTVMEAQESPLFNNVKLQRILAPLAPLAPAGSFPSDWTWGRADSVYHHPSPAPRHAASDPLGLSAWFLELVP